MTKLLSSYKVKIFDKEYPAAFTIHTDVITIPPSYMPEPDPNWHFTDSRGHEHKPEVREGQWGPQVNSYPTLTFTPGGMTYCSMCNEHHEDWDSSFHACTQCGEIIVPGMRAPSPHATHIEGTKSMEVVVTGLFLERNSQVDVVVEDVVLRCVVTKATIEATAVGVIETIELTVREEPDWDKLHITLLKQLTS